VTGADFDHFRLSDDHLELRDAVRALCEDKVAPHAAEVDARGEFPHAAYDALRASDFHAPHVPERYGGVGADALATCLVIEEVARVCASSSLIPAVNKLGTMPLLIAGSESVKQRYLPLVASGAAMCSYGLSEREAGSDTASMRTRA
jgi:acyl-CoA dehydrogenase